MSVFGRDGEWRISRFLLSDAMPRQVRVLKAMGISEWY